MKFGIGIPTCREGLTLPAPFADPAQIVGLVQKAEGLGYDSVWADDHVTTTPGMGLPPTRPPNWYDPLITLSACATATSRIQLCVGVVCLPFRNPVILAKQAATLDVISGGRFGMGWGLGRRDEYEHFNAEASGVHRGRLANELMDAVHRLLTQDNVTYQGEYVRFKDVSLYPRPVQEPPSIYVAGEAPETPNRVARWATGQLMSMLSSSHPIPERLKALEKALATRGREMSDIDKGVVIVQNVARTHEEALVNFDKSVIGSHMRPERRDKVIADNAIGTVDEVAEKVARVAELGIDNYTIQHYAVQSLEEMEDQAQIFAEEVLPLVKRG